MSNGLQSSITDYLSGFQYRQANMGRRILPAVPVLMYFPTAEGYVNWLNGHPKYVYNYTDHLGNIRLSYTFDEQNNMLKILEENHYYPFGLKHQNYNSQLLDYTIEDNEVALQTFSNQIGDGKYNYKYNGKEFQEELGFNWSDYGARGYMPDIVRWGQIDPLAEKYIEFTPYNFCINNPIVFVDPDGRDIYHINLDGTINVERTDDAFNVYYLNIVDSEGATNSYILGKYEKNEKGLMQLPSSFEFSEGGINFSFEIKEGNEYRSYISGDGFAALFGSFAQSETEDATIVGFSLSDGSSPDPSESHKNGKNGDLRYLRNDNSNGPLYLNTNPELLDEDRQNQLNNSLYNYGWTDLLSYNYTKNGEKKTLEKSRHFKNHHHHLHLQGFKPNIQNGLNPNVVYVGGRLVEIVVTPQKN